MGDEYRDDRGHFSTKEQDGGPCRHGFETAEKAKSSFDSAMREGLWRSGAKAVLYEDGWHHTGALYNVTSFYAIRSPRDIVRRLRETASFKKGLEKGLGQ